MPHGTSKQPAEPAVNNHSVQRQIDSRAYGDGGGLEGSGEPLDSGVALAPDARQIGWMNADFRAVPPR